MFLLAAIFILSTANFISGQTMDEYPPDWRCSCTAKWYVSKDCQTSQYLIIEQMQIWNMTSECGTPDGQVCGEGKPSGQKCLYQHLGSDLISTNGTHTTPICRYVDDITFFFQAENTGCWILGNSFSETTPSHTDAGTNYCNMYNLLEGSQLTQDPEFEEETNDAICTDYYRANCTVY